MSDEYGALTLSIVSSEVAVFTLLGCGASSMIVLLRLNSAAQFGTVA